MLLTTYLLPIQKSNCDNFCNANLTSLIPHAFSTEWAWQLYSIKSLHPPRHPVIAALSEDTIIEAFVSNIIYELGFLFHIELQCTVNLVSYATLNYDARSTWFVIPH